MHPTAVNGAVPYKTAEGPTGSSTTQALAEPSPAAEASAEPSITSSNVVVPPQTQKLLKRLIVPKVDSSLQFSATAIQKQSDIISPIWPSTTPEARVQFSEFCDVY